ncbi:unnamed protein product, partial [Ceratitis capitata]
AMKKKEQKLKMPLEKLKVSKNKCCVNSGSYKNSKRLQRNATQRALTEFSSVEHKCTRS